MNPGLPAPRTSSAAMRGGQPAGMAARVAEDRRWRSAGRLRDRSLRRFAPPAPCSAVSDPVRTAQMRHQRSYAPVAVGADAGGRDQHQALDALREGDRELRRDEPAHRVADDRRRVDSKWSQQPVQQPRVDGDRDLSRAGIGEWPKPGRSRRDHAMLGGERRAAAPASSASEPMSPCTNTSGGPSPSSITLTGSTRLTHDPALVLAPVDVEPRGSSGGAVDIGAVMSVARVRSAASPPDGGAVSFICIIYRGLEPGTPS